MEKRKTYSKEFKEEAIRLVKEDSLLDVQNLRKQQIQNIAGKYLRILLIKTLGQT